MLMTLFAPLIAAATLAGAPQKDAGPLCQALACSAQQRTELGGIFRELRQDNKGDREAIKRLRTDFANEYAKDKPSEKTLKSIEAKIEKHQREMGDRKHDALMEAHGVLSADQRKKLVRMSLTSGLRKQFKGDKGAKSRPKAR